MEQLKIIIDDLYANCSTHIEIAELYFEIKMHNQKRLEELLQECVEFYEEVLNNEIMAL